MYNLALCYEKGKGTEVDHSKAVSNIVILIAQRSIGTIKQHHRAMQMHKTIWHFAMKRGKVLKRMYKWHWIGM